MKKVLILTYYWPPSGGAGVQRWLKFCRYLPDFGVEPVVLTVDANYASYAQTDESLLAEVSPDLQMVRTRSFELYQLYRKLSSKKEIPYGGFANESGASLFQKISRFVRGNFLLPDPRKGWNKYAFREAVRLIREQGIDTVITTGPPHSTHLIGQKLQKKMHVKWIADMRDPWTDIYYYQQFYHTALARAIDRSMERRVLEKADRIITVSADVLRLLASKSKQNIAAKASILPNGFDEADFAGMNELQEEKFTITYTGTISEIYDVSGLIAAFRMLGAEYLSKIRLRFVGRVPANIAQDFISQFPELEIEQIGYVEHRESVRFLLRSSILLLVIPRIKDNRGILTGKFFEYLAAAKPILAIGPVDGDLAAIIHETQCGQIMDYADASGICGFIRQTMSETVVFQQKGSEKYSRRNLSAQLSELL